MRPKDGPAQGESRGLDLTRCDGTALSSPVPATSLWAACPSSHLQGLAHLGCSSGLQLELLLPGG